MEKNKSLSQVIVKAWQDPNFKEKLIKDPRGVLNAEGLEISKEVNVKVCENTDSQVFLVIPHKSSDELTEEQLLALTGGARQYLGGGAFIEDSYRDKAADRAAWEADFEARRAARGGG